MMQNESLNFETNADNIRADIRRLDQNLLELRKEHAAAAEHTADLKRRVEELKIVVALGQAKRAALDDLKLELAQAIDQEASLAEDAAAHAAALDGRRAELAKLEAEAEKAGGEAALRAKRQQFLSAVGPLLEAAVNFVTSFPGGAAELHRWAGRLVNQSLETRFASLNLAFIGEKLLSGGPSDFLARAIEEYVARGGSITPAMQSYIQGFRRQSDERARHRHAAFREDAKRRAAEDFQQHRQNADAFLETWIASARKNGDGTQISF